MNKRTEIIARLRALSIEMIDLGAEIDYFYGFNPLSAHGAEMVGGGYMAANWADEMEAEIA
jgi:hypothetical protein